MCPLLSLRRYSRAATLDGLLLNLRVAAAISDLVLPSLSDVADSAHDDDVFAFLAEFVPYCDTHCLLHLDVLLLILSLSLRYSRRPRTAPLSQKSKPTTTLCGLRPSHPPKGAGAQDEVRSLEDLKVFVLVPRSNVSAGQRPLSGKLVCKRKCDDTGKVVRYKIRYDAKGFTQ